MCILFIYCGDDESDCDYSLILATNRDESYDRPALNAAPWLEDTNVIGGRDMESGREGGSWLALSPLRRRLAVLLNLSGMTKPNAKGRGNIVADFVKSTISPACYIEQLEPYRNDYNDFNFVTVEIGHKKSNVSFYNNVTGQISRMLSPYQAFGNSMPDAPFRKVEAGKKKFEEICKKSGKNGMENELIDNLIELLRWDERFLPDEELERRCPKWYEMLSSVFIFLPKERYGTRTHTIILAKKNGKMDFVELTLQPPINPIVPVWQKTAYHFET